MNYEWIKNELISLFRRIQVLTVQHEGLQQQLTQLEQENSELQSTIQAQKEQLTQLQEQLKFITIKKSLQSSPQSDQKEPPVATSSDKKAYIQQIEHYIEQVDKCIDYLENSTPRE